MNITEEDLLNVSADASSNMFARARAMQTLCTDFGYTQSMLARRLGVSQSFVGNKIRLLQFENYEQQTIITHHLSERHARALLRLQPPKRIKIINNVANMHLTVQQTENYIENYAYEPQTKNNEVSSPTTAHDMFEQIQTSANKLRALGWKVTCLTETGEGWRQMTVTIID